MFAHDTTVISDLIAGAAEERDLPKYLRRAAEREYDELGTWLTRNLDDGDDWSLSSQGSMRLNTVTRPIGGGEYDLDSVARWSVDKDAITKHQLKKTVGDALHRYVDSSRDRPGAPARVDEKRRCWTLEYADKPFHLDVLPAIPDVDNPPTGIRLTDKELTRWLHGDPIAYADWFKSRVAVELFDRRVALAKEARVDIEAIPEADAPTLLHRTVQILKIHRDIHFGGDDLKPASVLVTTLAAQSYTGGHGDLLSAVMDAADRIGGLIEKDGNRYVVCNPVQALENFADRWTDDHARRFHGWLDALRRELDEAARVTTGLDVLVARLSESFGPGPIRKSAERYGASLATSRAAGGLMVAATGALTSRAGVRVPDHVFHGE